MKNVGLNNITEWLIVIIILVLNISFTNEIAIKLTNNFSNYDGTMLKFVNTVGSTSVVIGTIVYYIFLTILLHSISIIIDVDAESNFSELLLKVGLGFIFIFIAILINKLKLTDFIEYIKIEGIEILDTFQDTNYYIMSKWRTEISKLLHILWSSIYIKKIYRISWIDAFLVGLLTSIIIFGFNFIIKLFE